MSTQNFDYDLLYQKYLSEFFGATDEEELKELIGADLDGTLSEYGSYEEYADLDDPKTCLNLYSINEGLFMYAELSKRLS